jgi:hypothetical protein
MKLRTNSKGFGHIEMLLIVVAIVVIAGVGFFVYNNNNKKKAHAGGWTPLTVMSGEAIYGCWNGQWGNYSEAKIAYVKQASANPAILEYHTYTFNNDRGKSFYDAGQANAYWAGTIAVQKVAFNINNNVNVYYGVGEAWSQPFKSINVQAIKANWVRC